MKKNLTRLLSILLALVLTVGMLPVSALADGWQLSGSLERGESASMAESIGTQAATTDKYRIVHLDCGRKYFSVENIEKLIDTMAQYGYNQLELAFANDGCRFLLDAGNLDLTYKDASGNTIKKDGATVRNALKAGLVAYTGSSSYTNDDNRYLEETDVTEILSYAAAKGIEIVPLINMPGHAKALTYSFGYGTSDYSVNLSSTEAANYALALLQKYVDWFKGKVNYFSFGADEYDGFTHDHSTVDAFVKSCTQIIKDAGMTPRAFNDSICYNNITSCGPDTNTGIQLCHWGQGWSGYNTSLASTLKKKGYDLINTNGNWYYVLKPYQYYDDSGSLQYNNGSSYYYDAEKGFSVELPTKKNYKCGVDTYAKQGGSETVAGGLGTMFCIWCDQFDAITQDEVISDLEYGALTQIKTLAEYYWPEDINKGGEETAPVVSAEDGSDVPSTVTVEEPLILTANKTVNWTTSDSAVLDIEESADASTNGAAALAASKTVMAKSVKVTPVAAGNATITAADTTDPTKSVTYAIAVQAAETGTTKTITVTVNGTATDTIENLTDDIQNGSYTVDPAGYANVTVTTEPTTGKTTYKPVTSFTAGTFYVAGAGETVSDTSTLSWTFTKNTDGTYYIQNSNGNYIYPNATYKNRSWSYSAQTNSTTATSVNITDNGDGTIKVSKSFTTTTTPWGSTASTTAYLTLSNGTAGASGSSSSISVYNKVTQSAGYTATVEFSGLKVTTDDVVPTVTIGGVTYNISVVPEDLEKAEKQDVELWITNRELKDTNGDHTVSLDAAEYYGTDGAELRGGTVPEKITETISEKEVTYVFWKGVVLHNGEKQYNANSSIDKGDKSGSGTNFYKMRYLGGTWQYLAASGENAGNWVEVKTDDTLIAYYLQQFSVSDEITTLTRDYGDAPAGNTSGSWPEAWTATGFAVVRPGNVINRTDAQIYQNLMLRGWMSTVDYDGFGAGKQSVGIIYAENNSDFEVEKITIVKGANTTNTWPTATGSNNTVTWERETNEAGDEWFVEKTVWSADDPEKYGTTPILNGLESEEYCFDANNKCFLILIYLKTVEKETNLNFRYVDRTDGTVIYSSQISMKYTQGYPEPTYTETLKDSDGRVIGSTKNWPGTTAGADGYLPDDAYVTNSAGQPQAFNKKVSTFSGIDAKYKTGLYVYDGAEISEGGKTLTLYYNIDSSKLSKKYVVDFGLPLDIPLKDLVDNWNDVTGVAVGGTALSTTPLATDHGQLTYNGTSKTITYTLTKPFDTSIVSATFKLTLDDSEPVSITIGVIPASNVLYEENFLTPADNSGWTLDSSATPTAAQETQKLDAADTKTYNVFGTDDAYKAKVGEAGVWKATDLTTKTLTGKLTTTFYGNAFDLIGSCGPKTGRVFMVIRPTDPTVKRGYIVDVDTRYSKGDLYQVPLAHVVLDKEMEYKVEIMALGLDATTVTPQTNGSAFAVMSAQSMSGDEMLRSVVESYGLTMADVQHVSMESTISAASASASVSSTSNAATFAAAPQAAAAIEHEAGTHVEIDSFRVYRSSETSADNSIAKNYPTAEQDITYWNILDVVKGKITAYREGDNGTSDSVDVTDYEATGGPQNEIYLSNGQSVMFRIKGVDSIQVSLRAVEGTAASWATSTTGGTPTQISTNTEMYYTVTADGSGVFTIANRGETLLGIGNVKLQSGVTTDNVVSASEIDEQVLLQSLRAAFGVSEVEPEPEVFEPDTFDAKVSTLRMLRNKLVTIRISVSSDVSYVTVNGVKYWPGRAFSWQRSRTIQVRDTIGRNESKTYTIVAYDANGAASAPITVNG